MTLGSLPVIIPLAGAALALIAIRSVGLQRIIGLVASVASALVAAVLVYEVDTSGSIVVEMGGWPAPLGISLVVDRLAALLLATSTFTLLGVLVYAVAQGTSDRELPAFHAVYQILAAGVALALLTGDLFTLFVAFEIMLTASYVLMTHR